MANAGTRLRAGRTCGRCHTRIVFNIENNEMTPTAATSKALHVRQRSWTRRRSPLSPTSKPKDYWTRRWWSWAPSSAEHHTSTTTTDGTITMRRSCDCWPGGLAWRVRADDAPDRSIRGRFWPDLGAVHAVPLRAGVAAARPSGRSPAMSARIADAPPHAGRVLEVLRHEASLARRASEHQPAERRSFGGVHL